MPAVGDVLAGRYRIDAFLGAGGMATVYRATDMRLEREVAVKVLLPNFARDPALAERFDREARLLASVSHPSIADVFDVEPGDPDAGREPFYVMELCGGGSLADRIERSGRLTPGELVPLMLTVAAGLGELHRSGLIHRDIKPANILFTGGRPKLADFGLTRSDGRPEFPTLTEPGTAVGTPAYMAPELVAGGRASTASDVYALGATAFHALTGRAPRQSETITGLATTMGTPIPPASEVEVAVGTAFDGALARALATDPDDRPGLNAFTTALVEALGREGQAPSPAPLPPPPVDPFADTTRVVSAAPTRATGRPPRRPVVSRPSRTRAGLSIVNVAIIVAAVVAIVLLLPGTGLFPGAVTATPTPAATALASASVAPTPTASPTAVPTATPDPAAPALSALSDVVAAIDAARGGSDGLNGKDAGELLNLANDVRRHLEDEQMADARAAADKLAEHAAKITKGVDDERARRITDAIEVLIDAIPA